MPEPLVPDPLMAEPPEPDVEPIDPPEAAVPVLPVEPTWLQFGFIGLLPVFDPPCARAIEAEPTTRAAAILRPLSDVIMCLLLLAERTVMAGAQTFL